MSYSNGRRACQANTKAGEPCPTPALADLDLCPGHAPGEAKERLGFGGSHGGGRPRKVRTDEVYRERLEAERDEWWEVLAQAREAMRAVVVGTGPKARVEQVPDHATRLAAFREIHNRVYGRPKQAVDVTEVTENLAANMTAEELDAELAKMDEGYARMLELDKGSA
jgi:hypothetical protein